MIRFTVIRTIQSVNIDGNEPVDVTYYTGTDEPRALSALMTAAVDDHDGAYYTVLSARITREVVPDPVRLGITYEVQWPEDSSLGLDDCVWWSNQYQPWARVECSGRMARVQMFNGEVQITEAVLCEGHVNAYNTTGA